MKDPVVDVELVLNECSTADSDRLPLLEPPAAVSIEAHDDSFDDSQDNWGGGCCRICLESDSPAFGDELISPCKCKGTQQFVHRSCLDHWRSVKEGFAFSHCTTCKAEFHLRPEIPEDYSWRKMKFKLFVARDVLLVFLAVQTTVAALGGTAYLMDYNGEFRESFSDSWDRVLSKHPVPFYYCVGVFILFVISGVGGLIIHCSSVGNSNDPSMAGCRHGCYGGGILDCFPTSVEACGALLVFFVVIFAVLGFVYGLLAATMAVQRIWQRHYHILTKTVLTKEYIVEDMHGNYVPPNLDPVHEERLRSLNLI